MTLPATGFSLTDVNTELGTSGQSLSACIALAGYTGTWTALSDFANYSAYTPFSETYSTAGSFTASSVPTGCTQLVIECYGGGGAGMGVPANTQGEGGGGAGGQYAKTTINSPTIGHSVTGTVGAAGVGTAGAGGGGGGASQVSVNSVLQCRALGGSGSTSNAGASGSSTGGTGDTIYAGGDGGNAGSTWSGCGGGAAGSSGAGGDGSDASGCTGGTGNGGVAGDGGAGLVDPTTNHGNAGSTYGGAGGGAYTLNATIPVDFYGGNGARGYVKITYN